MDAEQRRDLEAHPDRFFSTVKVDRKKMQRLKKGLKWLQRVREQQQEVVEVEETLSLRPVWTIFTDETVPDFTAETTRAVEAERKDFLFKTFGAKFQSQTVNAML